MAPTVAAPAPPTAIRRSDPDEPGGGGRTTSTPDQPKGSFSDAFQVEGTGRRKPAECAYGTRVIAGNASTTRARESRSDWPTSVPTPRVVTYVPGLTYVLFTIAPVAVEPSPNSQW